RGPYYHLDCPVNFSYHFPLSTSLFRDPAPVDDEPGEDRDAGEQVGNIDVLPGLVSEAHIPGTVDTRRDVADSGKEAHIRAAGVADDLRFRPRDVSVRSTDGLGNQRIRRNFGRCRLSPKPLDDRRVIFHPRV